MVPFWIWIHPTLALQVLLVRLARLLSQRCNTSLTGLENHCHHRHPQLSSALVCCYFSKTFYCLWGEVLLKLNKRVYIFLISIGCWISPIILTNSAQWIPSAASRSTTLCWLVPVQQDQSNNNVSGDDDNDWSWLLEVFFGLRKLHHL